VLTDVLRQLEALGECLRAHGAAIWQREQSFIKDWNMLLSISIHIIQQLGIFSWFASITFSFGRDFICNNTNSCKIVWQLFRTRTNEM